MGGALKGAQVIDNLPTIGIDETVHDLPAPEVPLDEPLSHELTILPGPQKVLSEDDIVGVRAAVLYENCLRQLVTFLTLPVNRCTGVLRTGLVCDSVAPFSTNIAIRGTAMSVEWVSLSHHIKMYGNRQHCICLMNLYGYPYLTRSAPMDIAYGGGTHSLCWSLACWPGTFFFPQTFYSLETTTLKLLSYLNSWTCEW